ncbi:MAG TPA: glycosyltransferase family 87 protein [Coriobacteriia bacterium]
MTVDATGKVRAGLRARVAAAVRPSRDAWAATSPALRLLGIVSTVVLVGFIAAVVYHYVTGVYLRFHYPYTTFLFYPPDRFMDLYNDLMYAREFLAGNKSVVTYTPFSHLIMTVLQFLPKHFVVGAMVTGFLSVLALGARWLMKDMHDLSTGDKVRIGFVTIMLSYPVLFELDRMNQEAFVFLWLAGFAWFYCVRHKRVGLVFLAAAIAAKLFPAALLLIPLADRKWRDTAFTALGSVGLLVASAVIVGLTAPYGIVGTLEKAFTSLAGFHGSYLHTFELVHFGHAIWGVWVLFGIQTGLGTEAIRGAAGPYLVIMVVLGGLVGAYVVFIEKAMWRRVALCVLMMITFVYTSHDYTLLHVLLPVFLLVASGSRRRSDLALAALLGLLLVPLDYYVIASDVTTSVIAYPVISTIIMASIVAGGLYDRFSMRGRLASARAAETKKAAEAA